MITINILYRLNSNAFRIDCSSTEDTINSFGIDSYKINNATFVYNECSNKENFRRFLVSKLKYKYQDFMLESVDRDKLFLIIFAKIFDVLKSNCKYGLVKELEEVVETYRISITSPQANQYDNIEEFARGYSDHLSSAIHLKDKVVDFLKKCEKEKQYFNIILDLSFVIMDSRYIKYLLEYFQTDNIHFVFLGIRKGTDFEHYTRYEMNLDYYR